MYEEVGCHICFGVTFIDHWGDFSWLLFWVCRQITFVMRNRFCLLRKPPRIPLVLLWVISKWIRIPTKIRWKIHAPIVFEVLYLIKTCKTEAWNILLFVVCISFLHISRYHFSQIFRTSLNIISKKDFCHNFSFLMDSPRPPIANYVEFPGMKLCFVWNFWGWSKIKSRNSRDEGWDFFWNSPLMDYPDNQRKSLIIPQDNWLSANEV